MTDSPSVSRWTRFKKGYATLAVLVLNTILLVVAVEIVAAIINAVHPPHTTLAETTEQYKQRMLHMSYYYSQATLETMIDYGILIGL